MKVADLHKHLDDLGRFLKEAGASAAIVNDLKAIGEGLKPFADQPLKAFADFLVRAEAYAREGIVSTGKGTKKPGARNASKTPSADCEALAREVRDLYDRAANPAVTVELIDALQGKLAGLTKDNVVLIADTIDLKGMKSKSKNDIVGTIVQRIKARKGATQRAGLIDRIPSGGAAVGEQLAPEIVPATTPDEPPRSFMSHAQ